MVDKIVSQSVGMWDANLELCDDSTIASYQVGAGLKVDSAAKIINLGAKALFTGNLIVDVNSFELAATPATDSVYLAILQGSRSATFASGNEELACLRLAGKKSTKKAWNSYSGDQPAEEGRYIVPFRTERNGHYFQYLRLFGCGSATGATLAATAYLTK